MDILSPHLSPGPSAISCLMSTMMAWQVELGIVWGLVHSHSPHFHIHCPSRILGDDDDDDEHNVQSRVDRLMKSHTHIDHRGSL